MNDEDRRQTTQKTAENSGNRGWQGKGSTIKKGELEKCLNRESRVLQDKENGTENIDKQKKRLNRERRGLQDEENWTEIVEQELEPKKCLSRGSRGVQNEENRTEYVGKQL